MNKPMSAPDDLSAILFEQTERLLTQHVTKAALQGADRGEWQAPLWAALEEAGLPLALLPEAQGGVGLAPTEALGLARLAARHAAPVPLGETMIAAALWGEPLEGPATLAAPSLPDARGEAPRTPFARNCPKALVHFGGARVALVETAGRISAQGANLANEPRDTLVLDGAGEVREVTWLDADGLAPVGALLRALQMAGAMEGALQMALTHAMEREQFGRPLSKFQAIQQMLADAAGHVAAASAIADNAAEAWGTPELPLAAALAKSRAGEAAGRVAEIVHQVHAAMGFTQEHPLHFLTRRLWSWREEFGSEIHWEERVGRQVCAGGGEALWPLLVRVTSPRAGEAAA